jgi:hypothetical protein
MSALSTNRLSSEMLEMIRAFGGRAVAAVNTARVDLYWRIGEYICLKLSATAWRERLAEDLEVAFSAINKKRPQCTPVRASGTTSRTSC